MLCGAHRRTGDLDRFSKVLTRFTSQQLDDTVHQRVRLGILAFLAEADRADFGFLKETLALTDSNLSRHLRVLEEAGYVTIEKGYEDRRPRTWVNATRRGRRALTEHLMALQQLIDQVGEEKGS